MLDRYSRYDQRDGPLEGLFVSPSFCPASSLYFAPMSFLRDLPQVSICHKDLMLATPGRLFSAAGWIYELKYDGFRCLASKIGGTVRLLSRNGNNMVDRFPEIWQAMRAIPADFVIDAELVICDEQVGRGGTASTREARSEGLNARRQRPMPILHVSLHSMRYGLTVRTAEGSRC
jgi:hypothetical protein